MSDNSIVPTDQFSKARREIETIPEAVGAGSTIHRRDWYGNLETWVLELFRYDGKEVAFIQRQDAVGGLRLVVPPEVMAALSRQQAQLVTRSRRRAARTAAATREAKGIKPAFLAKGKRGR